MNVKYEKCEDSEVCMCLKCEESKTVKSIYVKSLKYGVWSAGVKSVVWNGIISVKHKSVESN